MVTRNKKTTVKQTRAAAKSASARAASKRAATTRTAAHTGTQQSQATQTARTTRSTRAGIAAYVRHLYDRSAPLLIAEALLFGAAAIYMFFRPMVILTFMTYVIGVGLIIFGLWRAIAGFVAARSVGGGILDVLFGLVNIILGLLFCIYPVGSVVSLAYIFVILFFFNAFRVLVFAINMVRAQFGHYIFNLIMAILLVAVACVLFFFPIATAVAVVYYLAIALLLYAAADIYMFVELARLKRAVGE